MLLQLIKSGKILLLCTGSAVDELLSALAKKLRLRAYGHEELAQLLF